MPGRREKLRFDVTKKTKLLERLEVQPDPREKGPQLQKTIQDCSVKIAKLVNPNPQYVAQSHQCIAVSWLLNKLSIKSTYRTVL